MYLKLAVFCALLGGLPSLAIAQRSASTDRTGPRQVLELRTYTLVDAAAEKKLDAYLEHALLPALGRQGLSPIGVFDQAAAAEDGSIEVLLLLPGPSLEAVLGAQAKLNHDADYARAGADYLSTPADKPLLKRIRSELLLSFECWPQVTVPAQKKEDKPRLFELRVYESPTEQLGELKVEMFNAGEVPIFLDSGIQPVFMGQALVGDKLPNLTYMTVYNDDANRQAAWKNFLQHDDWQVLKAVKKYQGTVSKIHKSDWVPKPYSQL
ncbi:MAG: NIPSNAP family protein [Planctomycetales bacterium]|nr:NIPSNAP family protein [Planctomycetales bacterium]